MSTNPTDVVNDFLQNTAPDKVEVAARRLVADEATYISLNFENPELKRILPWTGTYKGQQAFINTFTDVAKFWNIEEFTIIDLFGAGEDVAVFGSMTYRSIPLVRYFDRLSRYTRRCGMERSCSSSSWKTRLRALARLALAESGQSRGIRTGLRTRSK